jgi:hypothetical protein
MEWLFGLQIDYYEWKLAMKIRLFPPKKKPIDLSMYKAVSREEYLENLRESEILRVEHEKLMSSNPRIEK